MKLNGANSRQLKEPLSFVMPTLHKHQTKLVAMMRSRVGPSCTHNVRTPNLTHIHTDCDKHVTCTCTTTTKTSSPHWKQPNSTTNWYWYYMPVYLWKNQILRVKKLCVIIRWMHPHPSLAFHYVSIRKCIKIPTTQRRETSLFALPNSIFFFFFTCEDKVQNFRFKIKIHVRWCLVQ